MPHDPQLHDPTPPELPRLLTLQEAAEQLQVGRCTMQALVLTGEVRSIKIGRLRRIPPGALIDYVSHQLTINEEAA